MAKLNRRASLYTVLTVGEGDSDSLFLKHIKRLYVTRGCGTTTTVKNAHGKGPEHIIDFTIRQARNASYDRVIAFLDTDLMWTGDLIRLAERHDIQMIGSEPCFEGLLLNILEENAPANCRDSKRKLEAVLKGSSLSDRTTFERYFDLATLERKRNDVAALDLLINKIKK